MVSSARRILWWVVVSVFLVSSGCAAVVRVVRAASMANEYQTGFDVFITGSPIGVLYDGAVKYALDS